VPYEVYPSGARASTNRCKRRILRIIAAAFGRESERDTTTTEGEGKDDPLKEGRPLSGEEERGKPGQKIAKTGLRRRRPRRTQTRLLSLPEARRKGKTVVSER